MNRFTKLMAALAAFAALAVGGSAIAGAVTKSPVAKPAQSQTQEKSDGDGEQNDATEKGEKADGNEKNEKNEKSEKAEGPEKNEKADKGDGDGEKKDDAAGKQDKGDGDGENPNR